jgi:hypothetical protein
MSSLTSRRKLQQRGLGRSLAISLGDGDDGRLRGDLRLEGVKPVVRETRSSRGRPDPSARGIGAGGFLDVCRVGGLVGSLRGWRRRASGAKRMKSGP